VGPRSITKLRSGGGLDIDLADDEPLEVRHVGRFPFSSEGPYYALILAPGTLDTKGGPAIDAHGRVLDYMSRPIPGLYAAGNCAGFPSANAYWAGGATVGLAVTFGYLAARHAAGDSAAAALGTNQE
jgi:predicted oxidoreductase